MTSRRDVLAGLACLGALGSAELLRPRRHVVQMPEGENLSGIIPRTFGAWHLGGDGDIVQPRTEGSLASRLYSDELARIYQHRDDPARQIMLAIAYGGQQSDALQLHRPEACYPAMGFVIGERRFTRLDVTGRPAIPTVSVAAHTGPRHEDIVYWTRLGQTFPRDNGEQRSARLAAALRGEIPDGVLVRASALRNDPSAPRFAVVEEFLRDLARALPNPAARVLLG